jgi:hypothetical protein
MTDKVTTCERALDTAKRICEHFWVPDDALRSSPLGACSKTDYTARGDYIATVVLQMLQAHVEHLVAEHTKLREVCESLAWGSALPGACIQMQLRDALGYQRFFSSGRVAWSDNRNIQGTCRAILKRLDEKPGHIITVHWDNTPHDTVTNYDSQQLISLGK